MEVVAKSNSKRMYSWWWDSHNTPKNSKWLQENLADMDSNVKKMIKVLEEDADSFARRAEMYYRKRPELMQLVEEFYRAYRALAERYNHATGVIHKAHETISEAFPNQVPLIFGDHESHGVDPQTPEMTPPIRASVDPDEFHSLMSSGKARKGLNFNDGKGRNDRKAVSESERASKAEAEVVALKDSLSKMQAEKEANLAQFEKSLERLSNLESEVSRAQEDSRVLNDRAASAEAEIQALRETLKKLESEKESSLQKIADLEDGISIAHKDAGEINERASKAEADKEAALFQYKQCSKTISNLEERLRKAEEDARLINERAEKAAVEVVNLKQTISKLIEDKEASELQYQQCLNIIVDLKLKLYYAQEETQRLSREVEDGVAKLKFSEEKSLVLERSNQNLHSELDGLLEKLGNQSQKLTEKQTELVKLWSCVQEEHLRFQEAETAFQTLQQLHSQSQEEMNNLAVELRTRSQIMKDMEIRNSEFHEEIQQAKVENKGLNELNLSTVASIKILKERIQKLEAEVELKVEQRNAVQKEIYCLKEEISQVGKQKELQEENLTLKECNERDESEKMAVLEKLGIMEKLVVKNLMLENSISDLNLELETIRGKLETLEEACQSFLVEKSGRIADNQHTAIENIVLVEFLRQLNSEADTKNLQRKLESRSASKDVDIEKLERIQAMILLNETIKSLEDYVFARRNSEEEVSKGIESTDSFPELEEMCLRIKAISEAVMEKEKLLMLENSNANSMLEAALKQVKELKTGGGKGTRKPQEGGSGKTRKQSYEIEMITKDIVLDQTSDGSAYEFINKNSTLELDDHGFVELKPVKTRKTEAAIKSEKGKSLSEESLVVDKLEIFDGCMDLNGEVNKRKVLERLDSDLKKLENLLITVEDLKSKVKTEKGGGDEYETIKGQFEEAGEAIEKLFNVNRKLTTKAESEKDINRRRRISEQVRRGTEKIGRLQLEIQRIQFLLMKLEGEKENRVKSKISDTKRKVLLRDYIYGQSRSISMKKTKKRSAFCGCVQQPQSP